jgi:AcrR family transcriptional regulator
MNVSSTTPDDRPRRMSAAERRARIIEGARHEFSRAGFHGASIARIAAEAGCSEPMLYKHFPSKHTLFVSVLEEVSEAMEMQIDAVLMREGDPVDNWTAFIPRAMASPLYAEMVRLRALAVSVAHEVDVSDMLCDSISRLKQRVARAIERAKELGTVHSEVDPEYVAVMWLGITLVASFRDAIGAPGGFEGAVPHAQRFLESLRPLPQA